MKNIKPEHRIAVIAVFIVMSITIVSMLYKQLNNKNDINIDTESVSTESVDAETETITGTDNTVSKEEESSTENKDNPYEGFTKEEIGMIQDATIGSTEYDIIVGEDIVPNP